MKRILFVCTGNTCRSPLAEHLLRAKYPDTFEVKSAGLAALDGQDAAPHVHQLLQEKGISVEHKAQNVTPELMEWADLILTMTKSHQEMLHARFPEKTEFIFTLKEYVGENGTDYNISDPFGGTIEVYRQTMLELDHLLHRLMEQDKDRKN